MIYLVHLITKNRERLSNIVAVKPNSVSTELGERLKKGWDPLDKRKIRIISPMVQVA